MNYLVYEALTEAGMKREARLLAQSSRKLLLGEWLRKGHVHENYSPIDGTGCHDSSNKKSAAPVDFQRDRRYNKKKRCE